MLVILMDAVPVSVKMLVILTPTVNPITRFIVEADRKAVATNMLAVKSAEPT